MFSGYILTDIERKIERMFKDRNILDPADLEIENVASLFNIKIDFSFEGGPQRAMWDDEFTLIFLDPGQQIEEQREVFFHELAHPLLHCGDQTKMEIKPFRDLQEHQANQFQLYAAIPFFMLKQLELPVYEYQIIECIKQVFKVPHSLARKRLEQIKRRIMQAKIDEGLLFNGKIAEPKRTYRIPESFPLLEDLFTSGEIQSFIAPKIKQKPKVYYDFINGQPIPSIYCIEFNRGTVNWGEKNKLFPIDAEFEFIPKSEFQEKESDAFVVDISLLPSYPNDFALDLNSLKKQLHFFNVDPYNIRRFVIPAAQLEQLLQLDIFSNRLKTLSNYQQLTYKGAIN